MPFHIDTTEESDDYFVDQTINQIPNEDDDDPLTILIHAEDEYIRHGQDMVLNSKRIGEEFETD